MAPHQTSPEKQIGTQDSTPCYQLPHPASANDFDPCRTVSRGISLSTVALRLSSSSC